jgi:membrane protease YdiL (CAAX protease family)
MTLFGSSFRAGLARPLYEPSNPAGLGWAIAVFVILVASTQVLLLVFGFGLQALTSFDFGNAKSMLRSVMISLAPAGIVMALVAVLFARIRGGRPRAVLALKLPDLGWAGWLVVTLGFLAFMYVVIAAAVAIFSIDIGSRGEVERAMAELASDRAYPVMVAGVAVGIPLAEELTFRGQIFAALSKTRLGLVGASILTSFLWAIVHITEPWHGVVLIFVMGLVLSTLLVRFGSLWVTFICHGLWNGVYALALLAVPHS